MAMEFRIQSKVHEETFITVAKDTTYQFGSDGKESRRIPHAKSGDSVFHATYILIA